MKKNKYELRTGKFGQYFYDSENDLDLPLKEVLQILNKEKKFEKATFRYIPRPPQFPLCRCVREGDTGPYCPLCHSSFKRKWWFWKTKHCINEKCDNYYENI